MTNLLDQDFLTLLNFENFGLDGILCYELIDVDILFLSNPVDAIDSLTLDTLLYKEVSITMSRNKARERTCHQLCGGKMDA